MLNRSRIRHIRIRNISMATCAIIKSVCTEIPFQIKCSNRIQKIGTDCKNAILIRRLRMNELGNRIEKYDLILSTTVVNLIDK